MSAESTLAVPIAIMDPDGDQIGVVAALPTFGLWEGPMSGTGEIHSVIRLSPVSSDGGIHEAELTATRGRSRQPSTSQSQ